MKPLTPRNQWNHETIDTTKPRKPWNHRHHETYETINPLTIRNLWNYETLDTKKPVKLWNHWHHETFETMNPLTPRNLWNHETIDTKTPMKPWNHWHHETYETMKPLTPQNLWNHETMKSVVSLRYHFCCCAISWRSLSTNNDFSVGPSHPDETINPLIGVWLTTRSLWIIPNNYLSWYLPTTILFDSPAPVLLDI